MHVGGLQVTETLLKCNKCQHKQVYRSQELHNIVPEGSNYGYDVMTYIGESMFSNHKQAGEIQTLLQKRNIPISISEIEYLARKFIIYLSVAHERNSSGIVEIMNDNGGYILHLDALGGSKGGERLISGVDGISDIVLGNAKIKSENSDYIIPFLEEIRDLFGEPLAVVQDMGKGIMKAVRTVFLGISILICHFHFLRDIGKDLLEESYDVIRKRLRHFGFLTKLRKIAKELKVEFEGNQEAIDTFHQAMLSHQQIDLNNSTNAAIHLYTIVEWVLDWKNQSAGYGFPFDRPHFDLASRIKKSLEVIGAPKDAGKPLSIVARIREQLIAMFTGIVEDVELKNAMSDISSEIQIFDELRNAMRVAPENGKNGLNDEGECDDIKSIEAAVDAFRTKWTAQGEFSKQKKGIRFLKQIDKYRVQLFADPITVKTATGTKTILPQRTNNLMEQMFRDISRGNKRKTGVDCIGRTIRTMVADTPLIRNLKNDDYQKVIMGDKRNLSEVFAGIDVKTIRKRMAEHNVSNEKIPPKIQLLLKESSLPFLLSNTADIRKSNRILLS